MTSRLYQSAFSWLICASTAALLLAAIEQRTLWLVIGGVLLVCAVLAEGMRCAPRLGDWIVRTTDLVFIYTQPPSERDAWRQRAFGTKNQVKPVTKTPTAISISAATRAAHRSRDREEFAAAPTKHLTAVKDRKLPPSSAHAHSAVDAFLECIGQSDAECRARLASRGVLIPAVETCA